jgi:hypothetical protein
MARAGGEPYEAVRSLSEARTIPDVAVVMQGDDGGSIYLTCPARLVTCDEPKLRQLLLELDRHYWNDLEMTGLYYERARLGSGIAGGTGGGVVTDGVWLHPTLEAKGLRQHVEGVMFGQDQPA